MKVYMKDVGPYAMTGKTFFSVRLLSVLRGHSFFSSVLDWGLHLGPPALEASTIPLGYREGGKKKLVDPANKLEFSQ